MSVGNFDVNHIESWYFGALSFEEAKSLLQHEDVGVFMVRDSSRVPGEYVLCLREKAEVAQFTIHWKVVEEENQFYLREETTFPDIPSMLTFYKRNKFATTALIKPIGEGVVPVRPRMNMPTKSRISENWTTTPHPAPKQNQGRVSAPPTVGERQGLLFTGEAAMQFSVPSKTPDSKEGPLYARVTKNRNPSPYDNLSLRLRVGDLVEITKQSASGQWVGIVGGNKGVFPFHCIELISEEEYLQSLNS